MLGKRGNSRYDDGDLTVKGAERKYYQRSFAYYGAVLQSETALLRGT